MFEEFAKVAGKSILVSTDHVAKQANAAALMKQGDTVVLVTAVMSPQERQGIDFVPLTVEYRERTAAAGRVPGGFFKREMRPSDRETLTSRIVDRTMRPLFPKHFRQETQVLATVLSFDPEADPTVLALTGASLALHLSDIPWKGPVAGIRVARNNGQFIANPGLSERATSDLDLMVSVSLGGVVMVEGMGQEVSEGSIEEALEFAKDNAQPVLDAIARLREQKGRPKYELPPPAADDPQWVESICVEAQPKMVGILKGAMEKFPRSDALHELETQIVEQFAGEDEEGPAKAKKIGLIMEDLLARELRKLLLEENVRIDGRDPKTVRSISGQVGWLPRTHGSALFTRGETQAMVSCTLGTGGDEQIVEALDGDSKEAFMLHYNFPPYCVGEVRMLRGPGRREIGHGNLARRSLEPLLPNSEEFPYTIRLVSDISESNGSSSMATVCGGTLAMMDAGVPMQTPVAGIAMGLVKGEDKAVVLSDILGDEDHLGDMDFKVAGTRNGITALQLDNKLGELPREILAAGLEQAKQGRIHILDEMAKVLESPRQEMSPYAPRTCSLRINKDRIRDLIGPQGKIIQGIQRDMNVKIEVNDDGLVRVYSTSSSDLEGAISKIKNQTAELEKGKVYRGTVVSVKDFGAFVRVFASTEGLVHISELEDHRVNNVTDVLNEGDKVVVKVLDIDRQGKIRLSRKAALDTPENEIEG